jgi:hypothetical protein
MITIMVMSVGLVAVVASMGSSIIASDTHRTLAVGEVVVRDYADAVKAKAAETVTATAYVRCPAASDLAPVDYTPPTGWAATSITEVEYWIPDPDPANFPNGSFQDQAACIAYIEPKCPGLPYSQCDPALDPGLVRVTVTARNDRTDYAGQDVVGRVLVRRGNYT